jgi:amino acid adenylation domain-containing protein
MNTDALSTMTTADFLRRLRELDVRVETQDGQLRVDAPEDALSEDLKAELRARKSDLLSFLKTAEQSSSSLPPVTPRQTDGPAPLSYSQQRLWMLDQLLEGTVSYNLPTALRLTGPLDVNAIRQAVQHVVQRHDVLRIQVVSSNGTPYQQVTPGGPSTLRLIDLSRLSESEAGAQARASAQAEANRPFDLSTGPVWRGHLVRCAPDEHLVVFTIHHIATDGWSQERLVDELETAYRAFRRGEVPDLPDLPVQYTDYAAWQRTTLEEGEIDRQLTYWTEHLEGLSPLELPTDYTRPPTSHHEGASCPIHIPGDLADQLRQLAREANASLFMVVAAAFSVLLHRLSGQDDVGIGFDVAGRQRPEVDPLIGFFANLLVLRTNLSAADTFRELLDQVRSRILRAQDHQDVPFEWVVNAIDPDRDLARLPLVQVQITFNSSTSQRDVDFPGLEVSPVPAQTQSVRFDLDLQLTDTGAGALQGRLEYSAEMFEADTAQSISEAFQTVLHEIASHPDRRPTDIPLMPESDREAWTETHAAPAPPESGANRLDGTDLRDASFAVDRIEKQAQFVPDAVAVTERGKHLTYRALNRQANRVAHALRADGATAESVVALLDERSIRFLVTMLGIFKAGAAYLPLNPNHPPARLGQVLEEAQPEIILTAASRRDDVQTALNTCTHSDEPHVRTLDASYGAEASPRNPDRSLHERSLAYVIYTSGSTGKPKGAMVEQRAMFNHLCAKIEDLSLTSRDVVAQSASQCFDISVWQFIAPLLVGGRVEIYDDRFVQDPRLFLRAATNDAVTIVETVPSLLRMLLDAMDADAHLPALRWMMPTGEALPPALCERWFSHKPSVPLINAYGPTECGDDCTHHVISQTPEESQVRVPIGTAIPGAALYVVDEALHPLPPRVPGELFAGDVCVGRGYLHNPRQTAQRFLPDPFSDEPGARMYRTGDRARELDDRVLEFWGRVDFQVKVRGYRIELEEIEHALTQHPDVEQAVALAHGDDAGKTELVAYVVAELQSDEVDANSAPAENDSIDVESFLLERLPGYMVPAKIVRLDTFPLNDSGKVDRDVLPEPDRTSSADREDVPPSGPIERRIADIFGRVLDVEAISMTDDFFDLGGHSLLAMQAIARMREEMGVDLPVRAVFEAPVIGDLANRVSDVLRASDEYSQWEGVSDGSAASLPAPPLPDIEPIERTGEPLPVSFSQRRMWFLQQMNPESGAYNIPTTLHLSGTIDVSALRRSLQATVERHEPLRTYFEQDADGEPVQRIREGVGEVLLPVLDLSRLKPEDREERVRQLVRRDSLQPFDLTESSLRTRLYRLGSSEYVLSLVMHHIASDGWSMDVLTNDVMAFYNAFAQGGSRSDADVADLPVQYADYAVWQRENYDAGRFESDLAYWTDTLASVEPLNLPTNRPRAAIASPEADTVTARVPADLVAALREVTRSENASLFMGLVAVFQILLARYGQQDDFAVGTPIAGRDRAVLEPLVGCFINTLALRANLSGTPDFRTVLDRVRTSVLSGHDHSALPFERVVNALDVDRDLTHHPVFQVLFTADEQQGPTWRKQEASAGTEDMASPSAPGGEVRPFAGNDREAKFDLSLNVQEQNDGALQATWSYRSSLFDRQRIEEMARRFTEWIAEVVDQPDRPIAEVIGQREVDMVSDLSRGPDPASSPALLPEQMREQTQATPDRVAVASVASARRSDDGVGGPRAAQHATEKMGRPPNTDADATRPHFVTYDALHRLATSIADQFQSVIRRNRDGGDEGARNEAKTPSSQSSSEGASSEVGDAPVVAVMAGRTPDLLAAYWAAWMIGGVYVPLDADSSDSWIRALVRDSGADLLCVDPGRADRGSAVAETGVPVVSTEAAHQASDSKADLSFDPADRSPRDGAYLTYTSGTTGDPKGVLVSHGNLASYVQAVRRRLDLPTEGHSAVVSSPRFDLGLTALYPFLADGGTVHLLPTDTAIDPAAASDYVRAWRPDVLKITPTQFEGLRRGQSADAMLPQQALVFGGEALTPALVDDVARHGQTGLRICNHYGPTEATVGATAVVAHTVGEGEAVPMPSGRSVPIGGPLAGMETWVLDEHMRPVPPGATGELYLGGRQVARGYAGQPRRTAASFVPNPFSRRPGARLYRTGDRVRWCADEHLQFLGRTDDQVKIRGHRIELSSIESALARSTRAEQVAAIARTDAETERLVAFVVGPDDEKTLRTTAQQQLPAYAVPDAFVRLDGLPRTDAGKVDRDALQATNVDVETEASYVPPRTEEEAQLCDMWADVLNVDRVGIEDNFFDRGGHSLLAMRVTSRVPQAFGVELPVRALFEAPTVEAFLERIAQRRAEEDADTAASLLEEIENMPEEEVDALLGDTGSST